MKVGRPRNTVLIIAILALLLTGCIVRESSPAPGCVEYWGIPPMGGCFGTTILKDLQVTSQADCVAFEVNNCNGGVLDVENDCDAPLTLDGIEVVPGEEMTVDVYRDDAGTLRLREAAGNFSNFVPDEETEVEVEADVGGETFTVSFIKTEELCN